MPLSEGVVKLHAVCMNCHNEAAFSKRIGSETAVEVRFGGRGRAARRSKRSGFAHTAIAPR